MNLFDSEDVKQLFGTHKESIDSATKTAKKAIIWIIVFQAFSVLFSLGLLALIICVAAHFIGKYW